MQNLSFQQFFTGNCTVSLKNKYNILLTKMTTTIKILVLCFFSSQPL